MKIGIWGAGKLGLPVALAIDSTKLHSVAIYDKRDEPYEILETKEMKYIENEMADLLESHNVRSVREPVTLVAESDIIFVAVQTPHDPAFEGVTRMPHYTKDFDYSILVEAIKEIGGVLEAMAESRTVVIISTVLPGTLHRKIYPIKSSFMNIVYNPFFIAMGTTIYDFLNPEFVLLGADTIIEEDSVVQGVVDFYETIHHRPIRIMDIPEAELTKVAYNTFISMKIVFANTIMEICDGIGGMDCDIVMDALKGANQRIISPAYLTPGMGDGGGCHPRDNIAMAHLAEELDLNFNIFSELTRAREYQTAYMASTIAHEEESTDGIPVWILGTAYKMGTNLTTGSPAILLSTILAEDYGIQANLFNRFELDTPTPNFDLPAIFFIGLPDPVWLDQNFAEGSIVIDPWRYLDHLKDSQTIKYIPIGNR